MEYPLDVNEYLRRYRQSCMSSDNILFGRLYNLHISLSEDPAYEDEPWCVNQTADLPMVEDGYYYFEDGVLPFLFSDIDYLFDYLGSDADWFIAKASMDLKDLLPNEKVRNLYLQLAEFSLTNEGEGRKITGSLYDIVLNQYPTIVDSVNSIFGVSLNRQKGKYNFGSYGLTHTDTDMVLQQRTTRAAKNDVRNGLFMQSIQLLIYINGMVLAKCVHFSRVADVIKNKCILPKFTFLESEDFMLSMRPALEYMFPQLINMDITNYKHGLIPGTCRDSVMMINYQTREDVHYEPLPGDWILTVLEDTDFEHLLEHGNSDIYAMEFNDLGSKVPTMVNFQGLVFISSVPAIDDDVLNFTACNLVRKDRRRYYTCKTDDTMHISQRLGTKNERLTYFKYRGEFGHTYVDDGHPDFVGYGFDFIEDSFPGY